MPRSVIEECATVCQENLDLATNDIAQLQHQLKKIEADRKACCAKAQHVLWKQWSFIDMLEREKSELSLSLRLKESERLTTKDNKCCVQLTSLLDTQDFYQKELLDAKKRNKELDNEVAAADKELQRQRKEMVNVHQNLDQILAHQKKIPLLENRLNHGSNKYDQLCVSNSKLRDEIDNMLHIRSRFNSTFLHIKNLMKHGEKTVKEVIHSATLAYQNRDEAKYRVYVLRERTKVDRKKLAEQMKDLHRVLENDEKMSTFMEKKSKERTSEGREKKRTDSLSKDDQGVEEKIQLCRAIFAKITTASSARDVKRIVQRFKQVEDKNFTYFNLVNEMNSEIEKLHEIVRGYQKEANVVERQFKEQRRKDLHEKNEIEAVLEQVRHDAYNLEMTVEMHYENLEQLKKDILKLFKLAGCNSIHHPELQDNSGIITEHNILQYISVLETRILELLNCYRFMQYLLRQEKSPEEGSLAVTTSRSTSIAPSTPAFRKKNKKLRPPELSDDIRFTEDQKSTRDFQGEILQSVEKYYVQKRPPTGKQTDSLRTKIQSTTKQYY